MRFPKHLGLPVTFCVVAFSVSACANPLPVTPPVDALPKAARKPSYNSCNTGGPHVALTFDDGPHPQLTPALLDLLARRGVKATFYVVGKNVNAHPDIVARMVAEGHEIGNHTMSHPSLPKIGAAAVSAEITGTNDAIRNAAGVTPATMRPPYGAITPALTKRLNDEFGLSVILWSVDPQDWKIRKAGHVSQHLVDNAKPGAILLAHDIHSSTIEAMPAALDALLAKGYQFVTVSDLIALDQNATDSAHKP
jgi:peptidoglycan/xylan/chitin deacetylase (PgdA/CDA1 family)